MTLFLITLISAVVSYVGYKKFDEVTIEESVVIFVINSFIGFALLGLVTKIGLNDFKYESGYITSKIERESYKYEEDYTYKCFCHTDSNGIESCQTCHGTHYYTEPKKFYLVQEKLNSSEKKTITRNFPTKGDRLNQWTKPQETCIGLCNFSAEKYYSFLEVDNLKHNSTEIGKPTVWKENYDNYLKQSSLVFGTSKSNLEYFEMFNYDEIDRIVGPRTDEQRIRLNKLNSYIGNINIGIIFSEEENAAENINRLFKGGKINDFLIIKDKSNYVSIVGWDNFYLKEQIRFSLNQLKEKNVENILQELERNKDNLKVFGEKDLSGYSYLDVELAFGYYFLIFALNMITLTIGVMIALNNNLHKIEY